MTDTIEDIKKREMLAQSLEYWAAQFIRGEGVFFGESYWDEISDILKEAASRVRKEAAQ